MIEDINEIISDLSSIVDFECQTNISKAIISLNNAKKIYTEKDELTETDEDKFHSFMNKCKNYIKTNNTAIVTDRYSKKVMLACLYLEDAEALHTMYRQMNSVDQKKLLSELKLLEDKFNNIYEQSQNYIGDISFKLEDKLFERKSYLAEIVKRNTFSEEAKIYHQISVYYYRINEAKKQNPQKVYTTYKEETINYYQKKKENTKEKKNLVVGIAIVAVVVLYILFYVLGNLIS